jgi:hypothetical protein
VVVKNLYHLKKIFLLCLLVLFCGCNDTVKDLAKAFGEEMGVQVTVTAADDDYCDLTQFRWIAKSYENYPEWKKEAYKTRFKSRSYKLANVLPTAKVGRYSGDETWFVLLRMERCDQGRDPIDREPNPFPPRYCPRIVQEKRIEDTKKLVEGVEPINSVRKESGALTIQAQGALISGQVFYHTTYSTSLFSSVNSIRDPQFLEGLAQGDISKRRVDGDFPNPRLTCGKLADLEDLL